MTTHFRAFLCLTFVAVATDIYAASDAVVSSAPAVLWREPADIKSRDLFYGPGGKKDQPRPPFTFEKEDLDGTSPKFVVRDADNTKWKVKLGAEAKPETAATRLVWAAGYFADEDYFLPEIQVEKLPPHLHRGQNRILPQGYIHDVRLKRYIKGEEKAGDWRWKDDPFSGTRELDGLRVMMALINNWDLKDVNNKVYDYEPKNGSPERIYMVSDLGASFGTTGLSMSPNRGKGNLKAYEHSKFIHDVRSHMVSFNVPGRPAIIHIFTFPEYFRRIEMESLGKDIPVADCKWLGRILSGLSNEQITSAFVAAGYPKEEARAFAEVVEGRIAELNRL